MRIILLLLLFLASAGARAQVKGVVVDLETGLPVRNVSIYTNNRHETKTDWSGRFQLPYDFQSLTLSSDDYLQRVMDRAELTDTIGLLPMAHMLEGVTIWGQQPNYARRFQMNKVDLKLAAQHPAGINLLGLLQYLFKPKKAKQHEKLMEVLKNY